MATKKTEQQFLTVSDLAHRWSISPASAYRHVEQGTVKSIRFGSSIRVPVVEVERYERERLGYVVGDGAPDAA